MDFDWTDAWRLGLFVVTLSSLILLTCRVCRHGKNWNPKTKDYWFALVMWSLAGLVVSIEGVIRDSTFGMRLVFVTAAALVTLNGLRRKGAWGDHAD
jgi:hypothetical protein